MVKKLPKMLKSHYLINWQYVNNIIFVDNSCFLSLQCLLGGCNFIKKRGRRESPSKRQTGLNLCFNTCR